MSNLLKSTLILPFFISSTLYATSSIVDCRVALENATECYPYAKRLLRVKVIKYFDNTERLVLDKPYLIKGDTKEKVLTKNEKDIALLTAYDKDDTETIYEGGSHFTKPHLTKEAYGHYTIKRGDALSVLAQMFYMKTSELVTLNQIKDRSKVRIGQVLKIPLSQEMVNTILKASYTMQEGDTLQELANTYALQPHDILKFNNLASENSIQKGTILKLPLPYKLAQQKILEREKWFEEEERKYRSNFLKRGIGKRRLRVTATAYTSHSAQTDDTPFLAAWNNRLKPGMKVIAVSRDLLHKYGMKNGTRVRIAGLSGHYRVRDKMNKRYKKRVDIYMGLDIDKALRWGKRSVVIYW